jgi:hypothetical protein
MELLEIIDDLCKIVSRKSVENLKLKSKMSKAISVLTHNQGEDYEYVDEDYDEDYVENEDEDEDYVEKEDEEDEKDPSDTHEENHEVVNETLYHKIYRGFMIADEAQVDKIDKFYQSNTYVKLVFNGNHTKYDTCLSCNQLEIIVRFLYDHIDENNQIVGRLRLAVNQLIQVHLDNSEMMVGKYNKAKYFQEKLFSLFIIYHRVFQSRFYSKFVKIVTSKQLEMMGEGMAVSLLIFAQLHPELVCDDIYPVVCRNETLDELTKSLKSSPIYGDLYHKYEKYLIEVIPPH